MRTGIFWLKNKPVHDHILLFLLDKYIFRVGLGG